MIPISDHFDLGRDETRIKDKRDAQRQRRTVEVLLARMFNEDPNQRWELQLVADEVGMGKTFVALGLAYSVLAHRAAGRDAPGLEGTAARVLVIAPQNKALTGKWRREVKEFVRRCVDEQLVVESKDWFDPVYVERLDDLAHALRPDAKRGVVVTHMGALHGKGFRDYDLKRRFLLGVLFRFWGTRFRNDARARLLKGAPEGWPTKPESLTDLSDEERAKLRFDAEDQVLEALGVAANGTGKENVEELLALCKKIAEPYARDRGERFAKVESRLNALYRQICFATVKEALPLVIVDEAHNWKNGPRQKSNGYGTFEELIAPLARRVLLLTATPFQLRPQEMLELLRVGTVIAPSSSQGETARRCERIEQQRELVIRPVLESAASQSRAFAAAWSRLPTSACVALESAWGSPALQGTRERLRELAHRAGPVDRPATEEIVEATIRQQPAPLRDILRAALRLYAFNQDLSQELGEFVIRHRRRTEHRLVRVGTEFTDTSTAVHQRADRHVLHAAPGIDVRGDGELPHYLLMRCVSEMKAGKGRSSLGASLTGCYSTLLESAEGKALRSQLVGDGPGPIYLDLLLGMVGEGQDPEHPKVRAVVDSVLTAWRAGEKSLLFCFRSQTAKRLHEILSERIGEELRGRRDAVLGGADALGRLRSRFTRRDGELITIGLDRVLWSLRWAARSERVPLPELDIADLRLRDEEMRELAGLALRCGIDLREDQPDRVFLHRATECVLARRLHMHHKRGGPFFESIVSAMADETWVQLPYGVDFVADDTGTDGEHGADTAGLDERGVHTRFSLTPTSATKEEIEILAADLVERRIRARRQDNRVPILDAYANAPSFWLGQDAGAIFDGDAAASTSRTLSALHMHLLSLTRSDQSLVWQERLFTFQALRRALMRESILLRLLPERSELDERTWGELLVERFFASLPGQKETLAERLAVFVEDLQAAAGSVTELGDSRHTMYEATRMRDTGFVALVAGSTPDDRRERVFAGFNSPLLPEVLVCTSVGQEGIDLHRHCRNVVHYDLAWNPATLEQRTGRVDRIGSKTFRERQAESGTDAPPSFLDVGVPFLAGTYDERMYEEIRIRAQTFEVLTGGDVSSDDIEGTDDDSSREPGEEHIDLPMLPAEMVADLRVKLHVWEAE